MTCEICLDNPQEAAVRFDGFAVCLTCFAELVPNLSENALQDMTVIYEGEPTT